VALNPRIEDWSGRVVWLVGASSGIGWATASLLHGRGAQVVVSARRADALAEFTQAHPGSMALPLDATDREAMREAVARITGRYERIDVAVYCAGVYSPMRAADFQLDVALRHLNVNYVGALHMLDAVLPQLLKQAAAGRDAHLSLVASVVGYRGLPKALAYGPTKAALINLAETLHIDLAAQGIGVSIINPGFVATPATASNEFAMPALISAEQAAREIVAGWQRGAFEIHFPRRFTWWLKVLRHLGDSLYFAAVHRVTGL
jgi:NAD(P)-dependent dehydrogenase (short-subunit alcohol dehydrogenase family)